MSRIYDDEAREVKKRRPTPDPTPSPVPEDDQEAVNRLRDAIEFADTMDRRREPRGRSPMSDCVQPEKIGPRKFEPCGMPAEYLVTIGKREPEPYCASHGQLALIAGFKVVAGAVAPESEGDVHTDDRPSG